MPRLWNDTIETHRRAVREATVDATAELVAEHGLRGVTMSQIAEQTGIGRATLYKYFPDVEAILAEWHERQIASHLASLEQVRNETREPGKRLEAVLEAYALIARASRGHQDADLAALLHRDERVVRAEQELRSMLRNLLDDAVQTGDVRDDVSLDELAGFCLHALAAAASLPSKVAIRRLVTLTLAGLRPPG